MKIKNILFDLDGTLTDPKIGITRCIQHVFETFDLPAPKTQDLLWCIGPSITESMTKLLPQGFDIALAVQTYRRRYKDVGMLENHVYPGIPELLEGLQAAGYKMYVATAKPTAFAIPILEYFELDKKFHGIFGSNLDGTLSDKAELIATILQTQNLISHETAMVGDREFDIVGGKKNNLTTFAVAWGYGNEEILLSHKPDKFIRNVPEFLKEMEAFLAI